MYDIIVTVLSVVTALRSCNVNPHVCAETQLTHVLICEVLRTHLFVVKSNETSLMKSHKRVATTRSCKVVSCTCMRFVVTCSRKTLYMMATLYACYI